jgi:hypothetical protein
MNLPPLDPITIDGFTLDVNHYLTEPYDDIGQASIELPTILEWINTKRQNMYVLEANIKQQIEKHESKLFLRYCSDGVKRTAKHIDYMLCDDEDIAALQSDLNETRGWNLRLENLGTIIRQKIDMLRSAESTRRRIFEQESR